MKTAVGDLVRMAREGNFHVLVHGCNCFHTMGGGIAKQLRIEYPEVLEVDKTSPYGTREKLGTYTSTVTKDKFVVINAYTQCRYGEDPEARDGVLVDYDAVRAAFRAIRGEFGGQGLRFGIPKIGAGLARGDWLTVERIVEEEMAGEDVTVVILPVQTKTKVFKGYVR